MSGPAWKAKVVQRYVEDFAFLELGQAECEALVAQICEQFRAAARGERFGLTIANNRADIAFAIGTSGWWRPSEAQRDRMLAALAESEAAAPRHMPPGYDVADTARGFSAIAGLIRLWAENDEQRAERHPHRVADLHDVAEMFSNGCHNWALAQAVARRRRERSAATRADVAATRSKES